MEPATTFSQVLGSVVACRRRERGLTQAELAEVLGMTQAGCSGLERGRSPFTVPQLRRVGQALGVPAALLLREAEETARRLEAQGVRVLPEAPDERGRWLWIAGAVVAAAATAVVAVRER